jgi:uncharacterized protein YlxW (UPF0749 family)
MDEPAVLPPPAPADTPTTDEARRRLRDALSLRTGSGQLVAAALLGMLGFTVAIQLTDSTDVLERATRSDLVQILAGLDNRSEQLAAEVARLEQARADLLAGAGDSEAALAEAQSRLDTFGILAGTLPAEGPGVTMRIADPQAAVTAVSMLSAIQELRDAGAEAIQVDGANERSVRVVASTAFADEPTGGVSVGGVALTPPYLVRAIGDADTLSAALTIAGGAVPSLTSAGATVTVTSPSVVVVDALHEASDPTYARPAVPDGEDSTG